MVAEYALEIGLLIDIVVELLTSYNEQALADDALLNLSNLVSGELSPHFQLHAYMDRLCDFVSMLECLGPEAANRYVSCLDKLCTVMCVTDYTKRDILHRAITTKHPYK